MAIEDKIIYIEDLEEALGLPAEPAAEIVAEAQIPIIEKIALTEDNVLPNAAPAPAPTEVETTVPAPEPAPVVVEPEIPAAAKAEFDWQKLSVGGNLALLKQGTGHKEAVRYTQEILVDAGYLQSSDPKADNYINPKHFGFMNGEVTVNAIKQAQQDMKDAGADIKVDGIIYKEGASMLAALKNNAVKDCKIAENTISEYKSNLGTAREIVAREQAIEALAQNNVSEPASKAATDFAPVSSKIEKA